MSESKERRKRKGLRVFLSMNEEKDLISCCAFKKKTSDESMLTQKVYSNHTEWCRPRWQQRYPQQQESSWPQRRLNEKFTLFLTFNTLCATFHTHRRRCGRCNRVSSGETLLEHNISIT